MQERWMQERWTCIATPAVLSPWPRLAAARNGHEKWRKLAVFRGGKTAIFPCLEPGLLNTTN